LKWRAEYFQDEFNILLRDIIKDDAIKLEKNDNNISQT